MKRGKMLGGKAPRRGGRLTPTERERPQISDAGTQLLAVVAVGCLILGVVAGFTWGMDRQLRGGLLQQRAEAMQRPDWVAMEALPPYVPHSFLAVVDPTFERGGTLRSRESGYALPRELVRQIHLLGRDLRGEARELVMAPVLEQRASKRDILELYLNRAYLGIAHDYPVYGIHYAALEYFGKEATALTLGEAATLAGLLLEPRLERPEERPGAAGARRNEVLHSLVTTGRITPEEYSIALGERLGFQPGITTFPMSRRILGPADTAVIRLPPAYRPPPEEAQGAG